MWFKLRVVKGHHPYYIISISYILSYLKLCWGTSWFLVHLSPKMHSQLHPTIVLLIIITTTSSLGAYDHDQYYLNCSTPFQCSNQKNIHYPFWGSSRAEYCGHPKFRLNCTGEVPEISIMSQNYRILDIDQNARTLKVVRTDYWADVCPKNLQNTTLDSSFFTYTSDTQDLTIFYVCPPLSLNLSVPNQFNCSIVNETNSGIVSYFATESFWRRNLTESEVSLSEILRTCKESVVVRVMDSAAGSLEASSPVSNLIDAVNYGFRLEWNANNSQCDSCRWSGGVCGYESSSDDFTCFCKHKSYGSTCGLESGNVR